MSGPSYYAIIPANVRYCEELTANSKLLYGEITTLCNKEGYCWASNEYFANLYKVKPMQVSRWISDLVRLGFVRSKLNRSAGNSRKMWLPDATEPDDEEEGVSREKAIGGLAQKGDTYSAKRQTSNKENTTSNISGEKQSVEKGKRQKSKPSIPSLSEAIVQAKELGFDNAELEARRFIDYHEAKGWRMGNTPIRDWRAKMKLWKTEAELGIGRNPKKAESTEPAKCRL